jgi:hypothetical protein
LQDRIEFTSQEMDTFIRKNNEEEHQRAILEKTVRKLKARLVEQTDSMAAAESQARLQAENARLQHLVEARAKEYQEMRRSLEERHSATLQRLIHEHTAEMSEQMDVYEKELADLRAAHERELAEKPDYVEDLNRLSERIKSLGEKHSRNSEGSRSEDKDC